MTWVSELVSLISFRHLIWVNALLCWNNSLQVILNICKNQTSFPAWTINAFGKISWRKIPLIKPSLIIFFSELWCCLTMCLSWTMCRASLIYSLPEISVNSSSRESLVSLAQSKSRFCSLSSRVITEEIFCPERKQAEEDRRGVAKEINDRLSLKPWTCNLFAENVQGVQRQDICFMLFPKQPACSAADIPTCSSNGLESHNIPCSFLWTWAELSEAGEHFLKLSIERTLCICAVGVSLTPTLLELWWLN